MSIIVFSSMAVPLIMSVALSFLKHFRQHPLFLRSHFFDPLRYFTIPAKMKNDCEK